MLENSNFGRISNIFLYFSIHINWVSSRSSAIFARSKYIQLFLKKCGQWMLVSQLTFICSKPTTETSEACEKSVQS